jgi:DNA-binding protein H-NS
MPRNEEYDWIFDYTLQFLESDKFDAAVMDFVDEKCLVFEDEEENKLIYTDIHREFCDHVEALISSNLAELGITTELFLESCTKARQGRDINATVFERLTAMEDFQTFKKLMIKRNIELQLESIRSFKDTTPSLAAAKSPMKSPVKTVAEGKSTSADSKNEGKTHEDYSEDELRALQQSFDLSYDDIDNLPEDEVILTFAS